LHAALSLLLLAPAASVHLLGPLRTAPLRAAPIRPAAIRLSADEINVGGRPVEEGDGLLVRVKVHFMGTDETDDTWYDGDSPDLLRTDPGEASRSAFQSEELDMSLDDSELLEELRQKKWDGNSRWQLSTFAQSHLGEWVGAMKAFVLNADGTDMLQDGDVTACVTSASVPADGVIAWRESLDREEAALCLGNLTLTPDSFARNVGSMCVGGAYTISRDLASGEGGKGSGLLLELGVAEGARRVRVKLLYGESGGSEGAESGVLSLQRLALLHESEATAGRDALSAAALSDTVGSGLYDPPQGDRTRYQSVYCEGGVTLVFPRSLPAETAGFVSLDWTGGPALLCGASCGGAAMAAVHPSEPRAGDALPSRPQVRSPRLVA